MSFKVLVTVTAEVASSGPVVPATHSKRDALIAGEGNLAAAEAKAEAGAMAAAGAKAGVDGEIGTAQGELAELNDRIEQAGLDVMEGEAAWGLAKLAEAARAYASQLATVCASRVAVDTAALP